MYIFYVVFLALTSTILSIPHVAAQLVSTFSCYTVPDQGPLSKGYSTYYASTTSTATSTKVETLTTTIEGRVPDSTVTVHQKAYRTEWYENYFDTFTSVIWETKIESLGRPTITITLPYGVPRPSETFVSDELTKRQYGGYEEEEMLEEWIGEVLRPVPEERPTKVNTVICNTEFFTTSVETQMAMYVVNHGRPKRTITMTVTHTEVVSAFATPPAVTETTTQTTRYQTYTTWFQIVTADDSFVPTWSNIPG